MARKTKQEAEATRETILEAAAQLFFTKGVAKASLEEIAREAGVTRGAVYWHFKNKPDIFRALYNQLYTPFSEMLLKDLESDTPEPLWQLEGICFQLFVDLFTQPIKKRILTIFFLKCDYSGEMEEILVSQADRKCKSIELFSCYFSRAKAKGHLPDDTDPHVLTLSLMSFMTGMLYEYLRNPEVFNLEKHAQSMIQGFFLGLSRRSVAHHDADTDD